MDVLNPIEAFLVMVTLIGIGVFAMTAVATVIERAYERECRRNRYRPKIDPRERELLGDDWRDRI